MDGWRSHESPVSSLAFSIFNLFASMNFSLSTSPMESFMMVCGPSSSAAALA